MNLSGQTATFTYDQPVVCQAPGAAQTASQYPYSAPWWGTQRDRLHGPNAITCPPGAGGDTITLTYPGNLPTTLRFKYAGYGRLLRGGGAGEPARQRGELLAECVRGPEHAPDRPVDRVVHRAGVRPHPGGRYGDGRPVDRRRHPVLAVGVAVVGCDPVDAVHHERPAPGALPNAPCPNSSGTATVTLPANHTSAPKSYDITLTASSVHGTHPATAHLTLVCRRSRSASSHSCRRRRGRPRSGAAFSGQLVVTGNSGAVHVRPDGSGSPSLTVSASGAVTAPATLAAGTYTASGTDSDTSGAKGTWTFSLTVGRRRLSLVSTATAECPAYRWAAQDRR